MLCHQKSLAQVTRGSRRRAVSQTFSPETRRLDCRQNQTSDRSRKYQPFPTMPWPDGGKPVRKVLWTVEVTAGVTVRRGRTAPLRASAFKLGVSGPKRAGVSPTTLMTAVLRRTVTTDC